MRKALETLGLDFLIPALDCLYRTDPAVRLQQRGRNVFIVIMEIGLMQGCPLSTAVYCAVQCVYRNWRQSYRLPRMLLMISYADDTNGIAAGTAVEIAMAFVGAFRIMRDSGLERN